MSCHCVPLWGMLECKGSMTRMTQPLPSQSLWPGEKQMSEEMTTAQCGTGTGRGAGGRHRGRSRQTGTSQVLTVGRRGVEAAVRCRGIGVHSPRGGVCV